MNLTLSKPVPVILGGQPRVNLLPPETLQQVKERKTHKVLAGLVIGSLVLVTGLYGAAHLRAAGAEAELAAAQERTQVLLTEQLIYSDATSMATLVGATEKSRELGTSTEVLWNDVLGTITASLPKGAALVSGTLASRAPWEPELLPAGPLREPRVATLTLVVTSASVIDATDIVRRLSKLDGFADATPDLVTFQEGVYSTTFTLNLNTEALSGRFAAQTPEVDE